MALTHIITSSGFELDIDEAVMDDMEVLELVYAIDDKDLKAYMALIRKIMPEEDKKRLYEHLRVDGRVPIESFSAELTDIMKGLNSKKK